MIVKAEKISRQYFRQTKTRNVFFAVKETNFVLQAGQLIAITGRSGSGKSTMLNMMAGLLEPTTGTVYMDDTDLYLLSDAKRSRFRNSRIGVIPQGQTALHSLTVLENVLLPYTMYGEYCEEGKAMQLLEQVGIRDLKNVYPNELSGGELRRLAIARALIRTPEVLFADEPTSDLDDENTHAVLKLLREAADKGAAVLLVTHEKEAEAYADKVYKMSEGVLSL